MVFRNWSSQPDRRVSTVPEARSLWPDRYRMCFCRKPTHNNINGRCRRRCLPYTEPIHCRRRVRCCLISPIPQPRQVSRGKPNRQIPSLRGRPIFSSGRSREVCCVRAAPCLQKWRRWNTYRMYRRRDKQQDRGHCMYPSCRGTTWKQLHDSRQPMDWGGDRTERRLCAGRYDSCRYKDSDGPD